MYIVWLYKEDWTILDMLVCQACSPEQKFQLSSANTTQTIEEFPYPKSVKSLISLFQIFLYIISYNLLTPPTLLQQ